MTPPGGDDLPGSGGAPLLPYEPTPVASAVSAVKSLLTGLPPTAAELTQVQESPDALEPLIDGWLRTPQAEAKLRHIEWLQDCFSAVEQARPPVIAAVHGGCIGAGVDLAGACDIRLASADAFFQIAEVDVAITADLGTLQRLGYLIPQGVLRELTYTGRRLAAEEAARIGLVNRIEADREAIVAAGLALARTIAAKSPLAVAGAKRNLNHSRGRPVEEGLRDVALWNAAALATADLGEAVRARLGKTEAGFPPLDD